MKSHFLSDCGCNHLSDADLRFAIEQPSEQVGTDRIRFIDNVSRDAYIERERGTDPMVNWVPSPTTTLPERIRTSPVEPFDSRFTTQVEPEQAAYTAPTSYMAGLNGKLSIVALGALITAYLGYMAWEKWAK